MFVSVAQYPKFSAVVKNSAQDSCGNPGDTSSRGLKEFSETQQCQGKDSVEDGHTDTVLVLKETLGPVDSPWRVKQHKRHSSVGEHSVTQEQSKTTGLGCGAETEQDDSARDATTEQPQGPLVDTAERGLQETSEESAPLLVQNTIDACHTNRKGSEKTGDKDDEES